MIRVVLVLIVALVVLSTIGVPGWIGLPLVLAMAIALAWRRLGWWRYLASRTADHRRIVRRVMQGWPATMGACGLGSRAGAGHPLVVPIPVWGRDLGVPAFASRLLPGQTVAVWRSAAPALAAAWGLHSVTVAACGHDSVSAELWRDDPLAKAVFGWERSPARSWRADDPVLVGVDVHGCSISVDFTAPTHWIVQGQTRSGKSSLMYALLGQLSVSSAVVVAMSDPTGILASAYAGTRHAAWQVGGLDDVAAHAALLDRLTGLMASRTSMLLAGRSDKLVEFTPDLPLMVLVLEELPGLISAAATDDRLNARRSGDRVADRISAARGRLIAEGAKVGIRVVMLCQRADASILGGFDRSNVATRLTLRVDSSEAVRMLHQEAPPDLLQAQLTAPPGVGLMEGPDLALRRIRTPHVSYPAYLDAIERASAEGVSRDD